MREGLAPGQVDGLPFVRVLGKSEIMGWGPSFFSYVVYVERGTGVNPELFAQRVDATLTDERGWIRGGRVAFQRLPKYGNTQVVLASPPTVDRLCAPLNTEGKVSCNQGSKVVLNSVRWQEGVPHWGGRIRTYRQALINHEVGHRIGQNHRSCPGAGQKHPVMMQFTYGMQGCVRNSWPLASEL